MTNQMKDFLRLEMGSSRPKSLYRIFQGVVYPYLKERKSRIVIYVERVNWSGWRWWWS